MWRVLAVLVIECVQYGDCQNAAILLSTFFLHQYLHAHILSIFLLVCKRPDLNDQLQPTSYQIKTAYRGDSSWNPSLLMWWRSIKILEKPTDLNDQLHTQIKLIPDRNCRVLKTTTTSTSAISCHKAWKNEWPKTPIKLTLDQNCIRTGQTVLRPTYWNICLLILAQSTIFKIKKPSTDFNDQR